MKIAFMGTPSFAVPALKKINEVLFVGRLVKEKGVKELDSGPVLLKQSLPINIYSKHGDVEHKLSEIGSDLIAKAIKLINDGKYEFKQQNHNLKTYAKKITKEDEKIIWNMEAETVVARIHALAPSPGSYFDYNNEKLKIFECKLSDKIAEKPGHIHIIDLIDASL